MLKKKYDGQILAVVLVIMVVGVLIALAMMSRVGSDSRITTEENFSADALEVADSALDSVKGLDVSQLATWAANYDGCHNFDPNYDFYRDGCSLDLQDLKALLNANGLGNYYDTILESLISQCGYTSEGDIDNDEAFKVLIGQVSSNQEIIIEQDQVFSLVLRAPTAPNCRVDMKTNAVSAGSLAGVVFNPIYTQMSGGKISAYKEYDNNLSYGQCLTASCNNGDWFANGWNSTANPGGVTTNSFNVGVGGYYLYELRIRAVGDNIAIRREFVDINGDPNGCDAVPKDDMMQISSVVNCNGQSRGKMFVLTKETWAPAIFDYVLFNGNGPLELQ